MAVAPSRSHRRSERIFARKCRSRTAYFDPLCHWCRCHSYLLAEKMRPSFEIHQDHMNLLEKATLNRRCSGGPNITSSNTENSQIGGWSNSNTSQTRGAFSAVGLGYGPRSQSSYRDGYHIMISLDAQGSSSVYGRSSSVQPSSLRVLPAIKI